MFGLETELAKTRLKFTANIPKLYQIFPGNFCRKIALTEKVNLYTEADRIAMKFVHIYFVL